MTYNDEDLTPWFPADVKPVRLGVYEVQMNNCRFAYFDGERWGWAFSTVRKANKDRHTTGAIQSKVWRGLNKEPV